MRPLASPHIPSYPLTSLAGAWATSSCIDANQEWTPPCQFHPHGPPLVDNGRANACWPTVVHGVSVGTTCECVEGSDAETEEQQLSMGEAVR